MAVFDGFYLIMQFKNKNKKNRKRRGKLTLVAPGCRSCHVRLSLSAASTGSGCWNPRTPSAMFMKAELEKHVFMETLINFSRGDQSCCVSELSNTICPEALSSEFQSQSRILRDLPFSSYLVCGGVSLGLNPVRPRERSVPGFLCQGL